MVKKKDGSWRMCVDYMQVNKNIIKDKFPIPLIEELIDELCGSKTHQRHYEFLVMPFGLTNAPSTFQSLMNQVFKPFLRKFTLVFFDDILVYSPDMASQVEYLGHVISEKGVATYPTKIQAMKEWLVPMNLKQLRGFLGLIGYYRRFIKDYIDFMVETDASKEGIGAVLQQQVHLVAYLRFKRMSNCCICWSLQFLVMYSKELRIVGLLIKGKLVMGNDSGLQHDLIEYFHYGTMGGHSGVKVTTYSMCALLYWKKIRKHIKKFVNECLVCQLNKADLVVSPGLLQPLPIPQSVWYEVSMDFIDGLPTSKQKVDILVIIDRLSKYNHFIPLSHPYSAIQVAQAFLDNIYKLHGLPKVIVNDRDKVFFEQVLARIV
ncbi:putative mitochondrial protein [Tanacetum coccineum]